MTQKQRPGCCLGGAGGGGGGGSGNQSEEGVPSCVLLPPASWPLLPPPRRALTLPHASPQPDPTSCSPSPQSPPLHLDSPHPLPVNASQGFPDPGFFLTIPLPFPALAYPPQQFFPGSRRRAYSFGARAPLCVGPRPDHPPTHLSPSTGNPSPPLKFSFIFFLAAFRRHVVRRTTRVGNGTLAACCCPLHPGPSCPHPTHYFLWLWPQLPMPPPPRTVTDFRRCRKSGEPEEFLPAHGNSCI